MSTWGRAQNVLYDLWETDNGYRDADPGPAGRALAPHGVSQRTWIELVEPILEAVAPTLMGGPTSAPSDVKAVRYLAAVLEDPNSAIEDYQRAARAVLDSCTVEAGS